jgi:putative endopeptidase
MAFRTFRNFLRVGGLASVLAAWVILTTPCAAAEPTASSTTGGEPAVATAAPHYGAWGFDLAGRDLAVRPGDDFYAYAGGTYVKHLVIPADLSGYGSFLQLRELSDARVHAILEEMEAKAQAAHGAPVTDDAKVGAFYHAYMDEAAVAARGLAPLEADLAPIRTAADRSALAGLMGRAARGFGASIFGAGVGVDAKSPTTYAVYLTQAGLGLPDRDYYLEPKFAEKKAAYQAYVARLLGLAGWPEASARAADVVAYETRIAEASWTRADRRNPDTTYNPLSPVELAALAPGLDWRAFAAAGGLGDVDRVIVREKTAFPKIAAVFGGTPLETLKAWAAFHVADDAAPVLTQPFVEAHFDFHDKTLSGTPEPEPRWKRAVGLVGSLNAGMGDAVGRLYVARYFPPASKAAMERLVENLRAAFEARIERVDWMSPATRAAALEKLARYQIKIGYTSEWRDYSGLEIRADDLYGDAERAVAASWAYSRAHLGRPVDRGEWHMTPQTVNAYNNPTMNEVVFPAAILQPPFFDPAADPAVNYGGIVAVIGHEMTHGFDDQGRKYDASGRLRDWWTADDAQRFEARAAKYGAEFAAYDTGLGISINPKLTMGENIADLGGLNLALDAYHASLGGKPAPVLDGYTGDQRVFLGWAQVWRAATRPDAMKQRLVTDPHSPDKYRAQTAPRNIDAWYAAFGVKPGDALYIAPENRATIW